MARRTVRPLRHLLLLLVALAAVAAVAHGGGGGGHWQDGYGGGPMRVVGEPQEFKFGLQMAADLTVQVPALSAAQLRSTALAFAFTDVRCDTNSNAVGVVNLTRPGYDLLESFGVPAGIDRVVMLTSLFAPPLPFTSGVWQVNISCPESCNKGDVVTGRLAAVLLDWSQYVLTAPGTPVLVPAVPQAGFTTPAATALVQVPLDDPTLACPTIEAVFLNGTFSGPMTLTATAAPGGMLSVAANATRLYLSLPCVAAADYLAGVFQVSVTLPDTSLQGTLVSLQLLGNGPWSTTHDLSTQQPLPIQSPFGEEFYWVLEQPAPAAIKILVSAPPNGSCQVSTAFDVAPAPYWTWQTSAVCENGQATVVVYPPQDDLSHQLLVNVQQTSESWLVNAGTQPSWGTIAATVSQTGAAAPQGVPDALPPVLPWNVTAPFSVSAAVNQTQYTLQVPTLSAEQQPFMSLMVEWDFPDVWDPLPAFMLQSVRTGHVFSESAIQNSGEWLVPATKGMPIFDLSGPWVLTVNSSNVPFNGTIRVQLVDWQAFRVPMGGSAVAYEGNAVYFWVDLDSDYVCPALQITHSQAGQKFSAALTPSYQSTQWNFASSSDTAWLVLPCTPHLFRNAGLFLLTMTSESSNFTGSYSVALTAARDWETSHNLTDGLPKPVSSTMWDTFFVEPGMDVQSITFNVTAASNIACVLYAGYDSCSSATQGGPGTPCQGTPNSASITLNPHDSGLSNFMPARYCVIISAMESNNGVLPSTRNWGTVVAITRRA